ncbi:uncharacterized protein LOC131145454 [Malania oleifera]|uniref:uncharacterized protein LOC131145454 n=1 Tax=Malania oleifera TaxID=397392 RepID=UPI0025AE3ECD|nr:uncharacterized protein LOC131145454 [Malania oleifera]
MAETAGQSRGSMTSYKVLQQSSTRFENSIDFSLSPMSLHLAIFILNGASAKASPRPSSHSTRSRTRRWNPSSCSAVTASTASTCTSASRVKATPPRSTPSAFYIDKRNIDQVHHQIPHPPVRMPLQGELAVSCIDVGEGGIAANLEEGVVGRSGGSSFSIHAPVDQTPPRTPMDAINGVIPSSSSFIGRLRQPPPPQFLLRCRRFALSQHRHFAQEPHDEADHQSRHELPNRKLHAPLCDVNQNIHPQHRGPTRPRRQARISRRHVGEDPQRAHFATSVGPIIGEDNWQC